LACNDPSNEVRDRERLPFTPILDQVVEIAVVANHRVSGLLEDRRGRLGMSKPSVE
jgi:hypothetical protein